MWNSEQVYVKCDKTKTQEEALIGDPSVIYFTTDTNEIILNGISYGKEGFLPLTGGTLNGNLSIAQGNLLSFSDAGTISGDNGTLNITSDAVDIFAPVWADSLEANTIRKTGGTDQQVLMADGSVKELSEVSGSTDLTDYYTKEQIDAMLAGMQQTIDDMRAMLNEVIAISGGGVPLQISTPDTTEAQVEE